MSDFWSIADKYGLPIAMLIFAVLSLYFDLVVSGRRYRQVLRERDQLFRLAVGTTRVGERSASVASRALDVLARQQGEAEDDGHAY